MKRVLRYSRQEPPDASKAAAQIQALARPLRSPADLDPLLDEVGESRYVLLGEASHGTAEYYTWRTEISRRLITEKGFSFIAVEGDWPDCYRINRYVKGFADAGESAREVLHAFERWPTWMWANEEVVALVEWLRGNNEALSEGQKVGFYGLDVYSLWDSLFQVMGYLSKRRDAAALTAARKAFQCFEPYGEDVQDYARATHWADASCEDEVVALLSQLRRRARPWSNDGREAHFNAEQNALIVKNAENYYRTMVQGGPTSWNYRDQHMTETLGRLMTHHGPAAKAIIWEHNTHVGDARFTDMAEDGMINVGQLVRERYGGKGVVLVGFGSYKGSVIAGREWDSPMERMPVPPATPGSWEEVLHSAGADDKLLLLARAGAAPELLQQRGHRAIGVVYRPEREYGNYVPTVLARRYDAFVYLDQTRALHPLHGIKVHDGGEAPETYPSGV